MEIEIEKRFRFRLAVIFVFKKNIVRVLIFHFLRNVSHMYSLPQMYIIALDYYERNQQSFSSTRKCVLIIFFCRRLSQEYTKL